MTCMTIYTCIETIIYLLETHLDSYAFHALTSSILDHDNGHFDCFVNHSAQLKIE